MGYFNEAHAMPIWLTQQIRYWEGDSVVFDEPINTGPALIVYSTIKVFPISIFTAWKFWQLTFFTAYLFAVYRIVGSLHLTILSLAYPPLIVDSYTSYTSFGIALYAWALFFILKQKYLYAFAMAIPLMLVSQESFVLFGSVLVYTLVTQIYTSGFSIRLFLAQFGIPIVLLLVAIGIYSILQQTLYGSPLVNFIYNHTNANVLNFTHSKIIDFPLWVYLIRVGIFGVIGVTSLVLYKHNKLLFTINSAFFLLYAYFALFGYIFLFIAIQRYYASLIVFTILAIGYWTGSLKVLQTD
jgi:hypothetical protein